MKINANSCTIWVNGRFLTRKVTGVERVARELLRALDEKFLDENASCTYAGLHLSFKIAAPKSGEIALPEKVGRIPVHVIGSLSGHAWEQFSLSTLAPDEWLLNLCNTAPLLRRRQSVFFHDAQVFAIPENFDWKFRLWYRALLKICGHRSLSLFTNSQFSKGELSNYIGIDAAKIDVLHLGVNHMNRLKASVPEETEGRIPTKPFLLAVSSASPNKNFGLVIKAIGILGEAAPPCVFVGQRYSKVFADLNLDASTIAELGYVSDETLAALYERALCLVYPSIYEGFGLPPLEAMTFGTPVIVSNTSSLPEVCGSSALFCDPTSADSLATAIARLQADPELRRTMGEAGKVQAHGFTWQLCAEKMLASLSGAIRSST